MHLTLRVYNVRDIMILSLLLFAGGGTKTSYVDTYLTYYVCMYVHIRQKINIQCTLQVTIFNQKKQKTLFQEKKSRSSFGRDTI